MLLGGPGGSFGAPTNFPAGSLPASVAVADFNGDGKPDLTVTTHPTTNNVAVLLNTTVTNQAPTAAADAYSTAEDTALTVAAPGVLGNDSDPDDNPLSAVLVSGPSHGTLTLNADGSFTYTPAANYNGSDSFTYQASDGTLTSEPATVTLTVTAVNDAPTVTVAAGGTCGRDDRSGTINLTVGDVESPAAELTLSVLLLQPGAGADRQRRLRRQRRHPHDDRERRGRAQRHRDPDRHRQRWAGQRHGRGHGKGRRRRQGHPDRRRGRRPALGPERQRHADWRGRQRPAVWRQRRRHPVRRRGRRQPGRRRGNDRLTGGSGADRFSGGAGTDTATDFTAAEGDTSDGTIP